MDGPELEISSDYTRAVEAITRRDGLRRGLNLLHCAPSDTAGPFLDELAHMSQ
jgi:hypothetical protein